MEPLIHNIESCSSFRLDNTKQEINEDDNSNVRLLLDFKLPDFNKGH